MGLLVFGGSQGARVLSDVVPAAVAALPDGLRAHLRVAQQARPEDIDRVRAAYEAAGIPAEVEPFFDDIPRRLSEAQLVISRSGARARVSATASTATLSRSTGCRTITRVLSSRARSSRSSTNDVIRIDSDSMRPSIRATSSGVTATPVRTSSA